VISGVAALVCAGSEPQPSATPAPAAPSDSTPESWLAEPAPLTATPEATRTGEQPVPKAIPNPEFRGHPIAIEPWHPAMEVQASSTLAHEADRYAPKNAWDGDPQTAWVEGAADEGVGETLTLLPGEPIAWPAGLAVTMGYARSTATWNENDRVTVLRLTAHHARAEPELAGMTKVIELVAPTPMTAREPVFFELAEICNQDMSCSTDFDRFDLTIAKVERGTKYTDTALSEVVLYR
jgi:hypothetical protein